MYATQPREPSHDDYQNWSGYRQACLSGARRRRERTDGGPPSASAQRAREVLQQTATDPDRVGSVWRLALLGSAVARAWTRGGFAPAAIHQAICQARQE